VKKIVIAAIATGMGLLTQPVLADGVGINALRLIFPEKSNSITTSVRNTTKNTDYLTQVKITASVDGGAAPFVAIPPMFRLAANSENQIRIIKTGGDLPSDRESLFWFTMQSVPASSDSASSAEKINGIVQVGLGSTIKFIYRPDGLSESPEKGFCMLKFRHSPDGMTLTNLSPYYVSFSSFKADGKELMSDAQPVKMIAPLSDEIMLTKGLRAQAKIDWQAITDLGGTVNCSGMLQ
jgi:P pilus assembly chaperone PapD